MSKKFAAPAFLLAAGAALVAISAPGQAAGDPKAGEALFKGRCFMCHSGTAAKPSVLAPNLQGVGGRKAASTGFAYSEALKKSGLTWTPANLDKFLTMPGKLVPGTRMVISVPNATDRANIVAYISKLK